MEQNSFYYPAANNRLEAIASIAEIGGEIGEFMRVAKKEEAATYSASRS